VFDGAREGGHREDDAPNPLCLYGRSKLAGERAVAEAHALHLTVRVSWVFGPSADNFVKKVLAWASARDEISIVSDQRGPGPPTRRTWPAPPRARRPDAGG
jgi:dTDP-4-dehydrorhamnose reductase